MNDWVTSLPPLTVSGEVGFSLYQQWLLNE